jgi:multisubunit Na+/H+ antiporter MnhF subunit
MRIGRCRDELVPRGGAGASGGTDSLRVGLLAFQAEHRIVALGLTSTVQALAVLCLAVGYSEPGLASLAVVLAAMSSGGSVAFARFLERWL